MHTIALRMQLLGLAYRKVKHMAKRQQARHRELYNQKCRGAELEVGDLVLVNRLPGKAGTRSRIDGRVRSTRW